MTKKETFIRYTVTRLEDNQINKFEFIKWLLPRP